MSSPSNNSGPSLLWFAVPAAFAVRLALLLITERAIDAADSIHYIAMAQQFAAGDFLSFDENLPVLYSLLAAAVHLAVSEWEWAFWSVSLVASSLTVAPVYWIANELHGLRSARIMALLTCFWPWLVDYGSRIQPEALAVCLWFTALWCVYKAVTAGGRYLGLAPAALFALHLARPEGTILMLAAPVAAYVLCYREDPKRLRRLMVLAATIVALALIYMIAMRLVIGTATLSYRAPMAADWPDYFRRGAVDFARTFLRLTFDVLPVMLGPLLLVFMGLGLFAEPENGRCPRLELLVVFFCAVQYAAALANFTPSPRYIMPVVVSAGFWSAWGFVHARKLIAGRGYRRAAYGPLLLLVGTLLLGHTAGLVRTQMAAIPPTPLEYRVAGEWMSDNLEPGLILTRKPQIGFYADMPTTGPEPGDDVDDIVQRAADVGARYVVIDERYTIAIVPGSAPLLDPANAPEELKLLRADLSRWDGAKVVIYEVVVDGMQYLTPDEFPRPDSHRGPDQRRRTAPRPDSP